VEVYIPNPLRCFNCQRFGHGQRNCRKNHPVCSFCGANGHKQEDCKTDTPCCANCSGCHPAHSKECPKWQVEQHVQKITAQHGVSLAEARRMQSGVDSTCDDLSKCTNVTTTSGSFTRNIVLEGSDTNKSLSSLSPFHLSKALYAAIGTVTSYMPKKPTKWGMKLWCLYDSVTGYCQKFDVYRGASDGKHDLS